MENEGRLDDLYLFSLNERDATITILKFISWLEAEGRSAGAIRSICTGVRYHFSCHVANESLFTLDCVKRALSGITQTVGKISLKNAPNKSLGWILPLHLKARQMFWINGDQTQKMHHIGCALAFHFSLRIGEICSTGPYNKPKRFNIDHRFYGCDIIFENACDPNSRYSVKEYRDCLIKPDIGVVIFLKNSSKTSGRESPDGKPYFLTRYTAIESELLDDLLEWITVSNHDLTDHPIASRVSICHPFKLLSLTSESAIKMLQTVGYEFGLSGFTGKSLRVGGSTTLAAAGYSDTQILNSVGHQSLSSNQHYQSGNASGNRYALGAGEVIKIVDIQRTQSINLLNATQKVDR